MIETTRPTEKQVKLINTYSNVIDAAMKIIADLPTCRACSFAFMKLEESSAWFVKAVLQEIDHEVKDADRPAIVVN